MPSTYTSKNPQYTRASGIFKADSFTVYKLNISHLCDGACEGTSEWTISKFGYKNVNIKAVDPTFFWLSGEGRRQLSVVRSGLSHYQVCARVGGVGRARSRLHADRGVGGRRSGNKCE